MLLPFAQLEITEGININQKFLLDQELVGIGRALDNLVILSESNVSRHHAQIVWEDNEYLITDLGSTGGTYVNNVKLTPSMPRLLASGDVIQIGSSKLRFNSGLSTEAITTKSSLQIENTAVNTKPLSLPITSVLAEQSVPVLRVATPQGTYDFPLEQDLLVLGRSSRSDIFIDQPEVSVRHAQFKQCDAGYEVIDLNSRNGLIYQGRRITQHLLEDGDVLQIGSVVTLTYRSTALPEISVLKQQLDLSSYKTLSIGRDPQNDTMIDHPTVSRFHAQISRQEGSFVITDLKSSNGTFVNGKRINDKRFLRPGDTVRIGPSRLVFNFDQSLVRHDEEGNLRLDALNLTKVVGKGTTLLNNISLSILPREFVVIAGVSGGGKSTLLDALNGFRPATSGAVLVNGTDLYKNFNAYRTELGYVPQDDIIHKELTVEQALDYAAQLRMPTDTTPAERRQRVQEVLADLELTQRRDVPVKALSGGQRKRVSIGVELITKPSLFFLDEATSGLDPGTEVQIMRLLRKLADQGRTVLLITHATKNVMLCDLVVFLAKGGRVAYFGSPAEAPQYFGVHEFDQIYNQVENERSPEEWQQHYERSRQYQKYVVERQQKLELPEINLGRTRRFKKQQLPASNVKQVSAWQQFLILSKRNLAILKRDPASLLLMLAIAPILGFLDFFTWQRTAFDLEKGDAAQAITMLFATALIAVLVGSLSTMREIVKEQEIYRRERMIGLQILPYILSKVWIGLLLALYQAAIFLLFKKLAVEIPGGTDDLINMYFTLVLATLAGMVIGLLVSAISPNQNVAPLLTIIFLVPQITFGGGMLPVDTFGTPGQLINRITITKWSFEALVTITGMGHDVAEDSCWQLSEADRKKLTPAKKKPCQCMGPKLFKSCEFPGIKSKYDLVVDKPEPVKPKDPGKAPTDPRKLDQYQKQVNNYKKAVDRWQKDYSEWKGKYEGAIKGAEGVIDRFNKDFGAMFKVNVTQHWSMLGLLMAAMFGIVFGIQKRKDII